MENAISNFCQSLATFCNHVESATNSLSDSLQRRPIPLDSAASAFSRSLERRISSTRADLKTLDSMAFGTVSFEELLGHCNEVYKVNQKYINHLEDRMKSFGYIPEIDLEDDDGEDLGVGSELLTPKIGLKTHEFSCESVSATRSYRNTIEEDSLFEDSLSLQNLGLSDTCLAALASEDDYPASPIMASKNVLSHDDGHPHEKAAQFQQQKDILNASVEGAYKTMIKTSKHDYDSLPAYMKNLASWEEFQEAVTMMNAYLCKKERAMGSTTLNQDDLEALGLGRKGRSYLLLLLRMNQLTVENVDGSILYHVRIDC